jgi:hypothetical protein
MTLEHLQILEQQIGQLDQELATLLHPHQDAVQRLAEVPGSGFRVSGWTPRSRSLPKLALPQRRFPLRNASLPGLVPAPATKRALV